MRYPTLLCLLLLLPTHVVAQTVQVELTPPQTTVAIRTYGLGLLPLDGHFTGFHGTLRYDPDDHAHCSVALDIDAASLEMGAAPLGAMMRGPGFLDVTQYPKLSYQGTCDADDVSGQLTMHGVRRPFALMLAWAAHDLTATGRLQRADWGMTARPLLGGHTVRIQVTLPLARAAGGAG